MLLLTEKVNLSLYREPSLRVNHTPLPLGSTGSGRKMSGRPGDMMDRLMIFTSGSSVSAAVKNKRRGFNLQVDFFSLHTC